MAERKIRIRQMPDGTWAASADGHLGFLAMVAEECGSATVALDETPANWPITAIGATPWDASAGVFAETGERLHIEWETLPWTVQREAHGITQGVCELLGASTGAQRALAKTKWEARGRSLDCGWCRAPAPWNAETMGWRWTMLELFGVWVNNTWACPGCAPWAQPADPSAKVYTRPRPTGCAPDPR